MSQFNPNGLLSYTELCELVARRVIYTEKPDGDSEEVPADHINGASIDVCLGDEILVERFTDVMQTVDYEKREPLTMSKVNIADGYYDLRPGEFILAHTREFFDLPADIAAEFKIKSSGARIGLNNILATWCDPSWAGSVLTLELKNESQFHTIRLRPGVKIGQMLFYRVSPVPRDRSYSVRGRYNGDSSVQGIKP